MEAPTFTDVLQARRNIEQYLPRTPLAHYPALDELVAARVLVKHENHLPTGAFKVRGGVNLVLRLSGDERERGVTAASTGNHGQSVAYAAQLFGVAASIVVPEAANSVKVVAMRNYGAEVLFHGKDFGLAARVAFELPQRILWELLDDFVLVSEDEIRRALVI